MKFRHIFNTSSKEQKNYGGGDESSEDEAEGITQVAETLLNQMEQDKLRRDKEDEQRKQQIRELLEKSMARKKKKQEKPQKEIVDSKPKTTHPHKGADFY